MNNGKNIENLTNQMAESFLEMPLLSLALTGKEDGYSMAPSQATSKVVFHCTDETTGCIADLVRKLVQKVRYEDPPAGTDVPSLVLDVDVDGFHYTLLRSPQAETCHLSPRELEIARLVAEGLPNKCIGAILEISTWTVATHVRRIFAKLGVTSRAAMVARIMERVARQNGRPPTVIRST